jgi:putative peptidoglycan lipid II flippase
MTTTTATTEILAPNKTILRIVLRCVTTIAGLSLLAKGVGFLRDAASASIFGTGDAMDAYVLALSVPNLIAGLSGDAVPTALIPAYAKAKHSRGANAAAKVIANGIFFQAALVAGVCLTLALISSSLIDALAGDFSTSKTELSRELFMLLLLFTLLLSISQVVAAALQAEKKFTLAAVSPALIPAVAIIALYTLNGSVGVFSLAIGLVAGSMVHLGVLLMGAVRQHGAGCLVPDLRAKDSKGLLGNSMLLLLGGAIFGGCVMIDIAVASRLPAGTVATFGYADKVLGIVLSLAGVALGQALLPYLSEMHASSDRSGFRKTGLKLSWVVTVITLPLILIFWVAAEPITQLLFQRGEFGPKETAHVANALRWGSFQFPAVALGIIASRMIIAAGKVRYMCLVSLIALIANLILDITLAPLFGLAGIFVATAVIHSISAFLLFIKIPRS